MTQHLLYSVYLSAIFFLGLRAGMIYRAERAQFLATSVLRTGSPHQRQAWERTSQADLPAAAIFSSAAEGPHDPVSRNGTNREPAACFTPTQFEELHDLAARKCAAASRED
ncbi:hypothetical protein [Pseudorhodoplanes sinuspersici]|uniref:Uncharacterized protein n=1 Tax=Pseudorhodoplanes sinuspersici TaxID=1235591 RepID=A0A1W6ZX08_9HYPH|nr:hypothetical protein [Pseudorhodoplanes sinuspersici]ARQ01914.1 hypothetical protein CAK95_24550 [Pseudorhodoplanes sinuspersici]RKE73685.1 hypothetical protein DFP91_1580 [Pseudorhodoplanes sinuspersici]